jgi:hypothetical protein
MAAHATTPCIRGAVYKLMNNSRLTGKNVKLEGDGSFNFPKFYFKQVTKRQRRGFLFCFLNFLDFSLVGS